LQPQLAKSKGKLQMNMQSHNFARFGRGAVNLRASQGETLSYEQIAAYAPAVFAEMAHSSRSNRFVHIPSHDLLGAMAKEGFLPVAVKVGGSKDAEKRNYTKHMIRFRRAENLAQPLDTIGQIVPELILVNSHDGTSSYQLHAGLFRLACLNGLIVSAGNVASVKVGHRGNALDKVIEGSFTVIEQARETLPRAEAMAAISLSGEEQAAFARAALPLRFDAENTSKEFSISSVLRPRRIADNGASLWNTFNRVQESMLKGGFSYRAENSNGRMEYRTARPVNNVSDDVRLNKSLWALAESMAELKGVSLAA
jgi:hypothetical protein